MQPVKILHSSKHVSLFCLPQAGESCGLSGGRTVPTSHCPEARWQDNPGAAATPSRAAVMRGDRAAISDADGHTGGGKGIPRALMRNTTITRLPRSIATGFPSAKRGRCVHERDRWFKSVSLRQRVRLSGVPRTLSAKVAEGRRGRVREDAHVEMSTRLHSPGPRSLC